MQNALLAREDLFLKCLAGKMMTYALGRELGLADQKAIQEAVIHMKQNGRTLRSLIHFIAASHQFQSP